MSHVPDRFEQDRQDRVVVPFTGAGAGTAPLGWGQKAIWQDMQESGNQFTMWGRIVLPEGSTVADAAARLSGLMQRHAALRTRLITGSGDRLEQEVAGSGQIGLEVLELPDGTDPAEVKRYADDLMTAWHLMRFDFHRDWPLRMAVVRHRGAAAHLVWALSHLVADGGGHLLLASDIRSPEAASDPERPLILDVARSEQEPQLRRLSSRTMGHWETQLRHIPAVTFGGAGHALGPGEQRYWQARFSSPAAHLAMLAIAKRTGTDASRVALAMIATAIGRATGVHPLTVKVMVSNRFRPGLADVIAPIAQNSVLTIDVTDTTIDEVVTRTRSAALTAGMRAYYDPDELGEVMARLDAERGYPARVTCRVNDQRAMIRRDDAASTAAAQELDPMTLKRKLAETTLTWLGPRYNMHEQVNILIENKSDAVSLHMMWDRQCLTDEQVEALLRGVEECAVEAALDPAAPTRVSAATSV
jgi:hypothetical protein